MKKVLTIVALIFIPLLAIVPLLSSGYFTMHDVQHPVRLFLLDQGIKQSYWYPRWLDDLGFGYGYPLFNFYPPLIYYVAEVFVLLGFSIVSSLKLMLISGFILAAVSSYLYAKLIFPRKVALIVAVLYTYTFYHAITIYVRGAFAEFYSMALFPLVIYFLHSLILKPSWFKVLGLAVSFALLLICHPLIAFPSLFFIGAYFLLALWISQYWFRIWVKMILGLVLGLGLSAFFWLPSLLEKKFTMVDDILTRELYNYQLHFVELKQLYFSPWGFGGSTVGTEDGVSFQIGKYYLLFLVLSIFASLIFFLRKQSFQSKRTILFLLGMLFFAYFMSLSYSQFIWDKIRYLWYLQFPWRFFTFASFYLSLAAALVFYLVPKLFKARLIRNLLWSGLIVLLLVLVFKYSQLFKPQIVYQTTDEKLTNLKQRQWLISRTSFEFVPRGVATRKNEYGVTTLYIDKKDLPDKSYKIIQGKGQVTVQLDRFQDKRFLVRARSPMVFQLNTYAFLGWRAQLNSQPIVINSQNRLKLIRVIVPPGEHQLDFRFMNTPVRRLANSFSIFSFIVVVVSRVIALKKKPQTNS